MGTCIVVKISLFLRIPTELPPLFNNLFGVGVFGRFFPNIQEIQGENLGSGVMPYLNVSSGTAAFVL